MTASVTYPESPPAQGPSPSPHGHHWNWPTWAKVLTIAIAAFMVLGIVGLATGAGKSSTAAQPTTSAPAAPASPAAPVSPAAPAHATDANAVLAADGYTSLIVYDQARINSDFGSAAPYVTSAAGGSKGDNLEVVIIMNDQGMNVGGGQAEAQSELESAFPSGTVTINQNADHSWTIRIVEPASAAGTSA
jgi:hypothetical protein